MMRSGLIFFALVCASEVAVASDQLSLNVKSENPLVLSVIKEGSEKSVIIPSDVVVDSGGIYSSVALDDIDGNGVDEVIMTMPAEGGVNSCSKVLRYDSEKNTVVEVKFSGGGLCNYRKDGKYLVSSYRDAAVWVEDVYVFEGGSFDIVYKDECIGCGYIFRREFKSREVVVEYLVSDGEVLNKREPIVFSVLSGRAYIFSEPSIRGRSKKYLVRGDKVLALGFSNNNGESWVKIRFSGKVVTEGWLLCADIGQCAAL
ncbi:hypothetical protein E8F20_06260 [Pseudomonas sp. BN415]|uniref:hypothetical protein n=1 Tax=Pseudomonas sp. BN415 TaxID=2567889 RepID=UPI002458232D|nr:hypothetical protein [Pseudomonas sp. BN415]MDH4581478.1 hypothetical protein [Pseudomonas sp. BN415]